MQKMISSRWDFMWISRYNHIRKRSSKNHLSLARSRKVFRQPSTFIVTEAERILRLSFTTRESAGRRWEKRKSGAESHELFHLLSCSNDSPRRMTARAKKGLVCKGLHEVMQNKCTGEYLLRSSFDAWIVWRGSTRSRDDLGRLLFDTLCSVSFLPLCTLKLQNTTGRSASALIYCRTTEKALRNFKNMQDCKIQGPGSRRASCLTCLNEAGLRGICLSLFCRLRKKIRDWDFCLSLANSLKYNFAVNYKRKKFFIKILSYKLYVFKLYSLINNKTIKKLIKMFSFNLKISY